MIGVPSNERTICFRRIVPYWSWPAACWVVTMPAIDRMATAAPAFAQDGPPPSRDDATFTGPRVGVILGYDKLQPGRGPNSSISSDRKADGLTYGGDFGYDVALNRFVIGAEGEVTGAPQRVAFPNRLNLQLVKVQDMRYGENPHQAAAFYRDLDPAAGSIANYRQLQGKELSYNNIADADAAWEAVKTFDAPACVIVKHANPCGVAVAADPLSAYRLAFATDTTSAFGGIIAFNRTVDKAAAEAVVKQFVEVLMAPDFTAEALEIFKPKVNVRLMKIALP